MLNTTRPIVLGTVRTARRPWTAQVYTFCAGFLVATACRTDTWPAALIWASLGGLLLFVARRLECWRS